MTMQLSKRLMCTRRKNPYSYEYSTPYPLNIANPSDGITINNIGFSERQHRLLGTLGFEEFSINNLEFLSNNTLRTPLITQNAETVAFSINNLSMISGTLRETLVSYNSSYNSDSFVINNLTLRADVPSKLENKLIIYTVATSENISINNLSILSGTLA